MLWSSPEKSLSAGQILPVYIRSNIEKLYVVGLPESGAKTEVPLWQLEFFSSKRKAQARAEELGANLRLYMAAARDGLPIRKNPENSADPANRVFRLREGQIVKVLAKVKGAAVETGGQALAGDWYLVMAEGGTRGYVFSYAMKIFDEAKEGPPSSAAESAPLSGREDLVFSKSWRPRYFQQMLDDQRLDLDYFSLRYGLFTDAVRRQIRVELPGSSRYFNYSSISESRGVYSFEGTPLKIRIENDRRLLVWWTPAAFDPTLAASSSDDGLDPAAQTGDAAAAEGADGRAVFVALDIDPREAIRAEDLRRQKLLEDFLASAGSAWTSSEAGRLSIDRSRRFTWTGRSALPPGIVPSGYGETGEIAFRLFIAPNPASTWTGAFSLRFDPATDGSAGSKPVWLNFLYRMDSGSLVLARAAAASGLVIAGDDTEIDSLVLSASR